MAEERKPRGFLERAGSKLIDAGYQIVPIKPGTKRPPMDGWENIKATKRQLKQWLENGQRRAGVGILTAETPAVDIDVRDPKVARHMVDFVQARYGIAPVRVGQAPKSLLLFRADEPFTKIQSRTFINPFEAETDSEGKIPGSKVEILGVGQQFVAYAIHPDTGEPYKWLDGDSPVKTPVADLPVLTADDAREIVAEFERIAEAEGWERKAGRALATTGRTTRGRVAHDDVFAADKAKVEDLSDEEIGRKLLLVPGADDYDTWLQIGFALYHQFDGNDEGLALWHKWSSTADNYDADVLDDKWSTFDVEGKGREPVTARLIIKLADEEQQRIATETYAEIKDDLEAAETIDALNEVCDRIRQIQFPPLKRNELTGIVQRRYKKITTVLLTIGMARELTRYENPAIKETPRWLEDWVYVSSSNTYYNRRTGGEVKRDAFDSAHGRLMLTPSDVLQGRAIPETPASMFALNVVQIPVVDYLMYLPGEDDFFTYNGRRCVNTYSDGEIPQPPDRLDREERAAVETVKHHFSHLFAHPRDRRIFMDALAYVVQNPGKRLNWAILLQGVEKDGKSFFSHLLATVLGPANVKNVIAQALEEKFNSWAQGSQVVFFEEIKLHGHNRYDVLNKVKPLITNPTIPIRRMQQDYYEAHNTATYILTTNYKDALPLDENSSRYFILFSRFQTAEDLNAYLATDPDYYTRLYEALTHGGALRKWLLEHETGPDFHPLRRAPQSIAKMEMVALNKTDEDEALEEILAEGHHDISPMLLNSSRLADLMSDRGISPPYGRAMNNLLLRYGFTRLGKVWGGEGSVLVWSREPDRWTDKNGRPLSDKIRLYLADDI